jgi:hypothetical protein
MEACPPAVRTFSLKGCRPCTPVEDHVIMHIPTSGTSLDHAYAYKRYVLRSCIYLQAVRLSIMHMPTSGTSLDHAYTYKRYVSRSCICLQAVRLSIMHIPTSGTSLNHAYTYLWSISRTYLYIQRHMHVMHEAYRYKELTTVVQPLSNSMLALLTCKQSRSSKQ